MTAVAQMTVPPLVSSIPDRCRVCYACVRECPAKAIRILHGQAAVVAERCIGCGNCVRVCSQGAKAVLDGTAAVRLLLHGPAPVAVLVAPSFPAEFADCGAAIMVGMLRRLGFARVCETAFGADLVAREYRRTFTDHPDRHYIATTCPAVVAYIEYYRPHLLPRLMPVVSPMVAAARVLRAMDANLRIVFVGPCIAKKAEALSEDLDGEVDAVLTFAELRAMFQEQAIAPHATAPSEFDPPVAGRGRLFALTRGLLETAGIREELVNNDVVASDGRESFLDAIDEFDAGALDAHLLEVLCCQGCIMGAGMTNRRMPQFKRRALVSDYVRRRLAAAPRDPPAPGPPIPDVDLTRGFRVRDRRLPTPSSEEVDAILAKMGKFTTADELNCGACGYPSCREHAVAIHKGLAEDEMCLPYTIERLQETIQKLAASNEEVATIQNALAHSEKLASMGQLAAGVAHEVNNPLGIVLMYAHLLIESHGDADAALRKDLQVIATQADRCKRIVAGLLDFARQNKVLRERTHMVKLVEDAVRAVALPAAVAVTQTSALNDPFAEVDPDQIAQVLVNLLSNAQAAMPRGGRLTIDLSGDADNVTLHVSDTGTGISAENLSRIFDPFFTTKQIGTGTGLGLAVTYGIVKMHRGQIKVKSNTDPTRGETGSTFTIVLPRKER